MRRALPLLLLLAACGPDFQPSSSVQKLRLLAVQAEPPEIGPAGAPGVPEAARIASLVADPAQLADPAAGEEDRRVAWVFHFACTPDPSWDEESGEPPPANCTSYASLASAGAFFTGQEGGGGRDCTAVAPGCVNFIGLERCEHGGSCTPAGTLAGLPVPAPAYALPQGLSFEGRYGEVVVVSLAVSASEKELVSGQPPLGGIGPILQDDPGQERHMIAVKRIAVRGATAEDAPNLNPGIAGILARGEPLGPEPAEFPLAGKLELLPRPVAGCSGESCPLVQDYTRYDSEGRPLERRREAWLYAWYVTSGKMRRRSLPGADEVQVWYGPRSPDGMADPAAPGEPGEPGIMYLVVRDRRGGVAWTTGPYVLSR